MAVPSIIICRLSRNSLQQLVEIENETEHPAWNATLFAQEFTNPVSSVWGVRHEGKLVGFLTCHTVVDEGHILNVALRKQVRGKGIGRALVCEVLRELHSHAIKWVTLEVRVSNTVARKLYESLGFLEVSKRERYYSDNGEDAVVMSLNLRQFMDEFGAMEEAAVGNW